MRERGDWDGLLANRDRAEPSTTIVAPIRASSSGSSAFLALADDDCSYWVKVPGNPQGDSILSAEQIVAGAAELIGAPTATTKLVTIPSALTGWEYGQFYYLSPGVAHASELLDNVEESDEALYLDRDDNENRFPLLFALWDWCLGEDPQWLYDQKNDMSVWSFDHGWWLGGGPAWDAESLVRLVDRDWEWPPLAEIWRSSDEGWSQASEKLENIQPDDVLDAVARVPTTWGVSNSDLETVAWMLYRRAPAVAERLQRRSGRC
ncbi:HipA family kinase [Mumia flava]|nr:HipA family kinase [Mumia flava]